jgi:hypothetical protein
LDAIGGKAAADVNPLNEAMLKATQRTKTVTMLGLTVPSTFIALADEMIE